MRTPSPSWCGLDRTHLWPTGSSLGDPLITARNFSSCPSDSISRWTPCPPETASGGFRSALAVSDFRLRARLDVSIPSTSPASEAFNPAFGYSAPHPSTGGTSTLLINALLSAHHDSVGVAAIGRYSFLVAGVIGPNRQDTAVLFEALLTLRAGATGIDETTNAHFVAHLVFCDRVADRAHNSGDLVPGNHGEDRFFLVVAPLVAGLVNVRITYPAILNIDDDIVLARFAAFERIRRQRGLGFQCGVAFALAHDSTLFPKNVGRMISL